MNITFHPSKTDDLREIRPKHSGRQWPNYVHYQDKSEIYWLHPKLRPVSVGVTY